MRHARKRRRSKLKKLAGQMPTRVDLKLTYGIKKRDEAMTRRYEDNKYKRLAMLMRENGLGFLSPSGLST
jgi:hypothetical protein